MAVLHEGANPNARVLLPDSYAGSYESNMNRTVTQQSRSSTMLQILPSAGLGHVIDLAE